MRLLAHRHAHRCNGESYDTVAIARKAFRLASQPLLREAELISQHECRGGGVTLSDNPDHGLLLAIHDDASDADELWCSPGLDEVIEHYKGWVRRLS